MNVPYYYCLLNKYMPLLTPKSGETVWNISILISFIRCLPLNYRLLQDEIKTKEGNYHIIYDPTMGHVFYVYLKEPIQVVVINPPKVPIKLINPFLNYSDVRKYYRKSSDVNFKTCMYELNFVMNFYSIGSKKSTIYYKMSEASLSILKKLSRIYPNNAEIAAEKILAIESYSLQQKINIFNCITVDVDLLSILKSLIGYTKVYIHKTEENEIKFDQNSSIHGFIWITPWALEAIKKFQYIELDCTFEILKPYVTSIPQIIANGLSLPLGFIVGPKENWVIYKCFYDELIQLMGNDFKLKSLPILSDHGPGIEKFCTEYSLEQYLCIRHIINIVGPKSFLGKLTAKLLMSQTKEQFENNYDNILKLANAFYNSLDLTHKNITLSFLKYCFMKLIPEERKIVKNLENTDLLNKTILYKRGHIAAASNHSEGFHSKLKTIAKEHKGFIYNLTMLKDLINKRWEKYASGLSAEKQCQRIKESLKKKQKLYKINPIENCNYDTNCHIQLILGKQLPCIHTINESTNITMKYPNLDPTKFICNNIFSVDTSKLEGIVSFDQRGRPEKMSDEENYDECLLLLDKLMNQSKAFIVYYSDPSKFTKETESAFRNTVIEAIKLGLPKEKLEDFYTFLSMDFIAVNYDLDQFINNKFISIGRYFGIKGII